MGHRGEEGLGSHSKTSPPSRVMWRIEAEERRGSGNVRLGDARIPKRHDSWEAERICPEEKKAFAAEQNRPWHVECKLHEPENWGACFEEVRKRCTKQHSFDHLPAENEENQSTFVRPTPLHDVI
eukprot:727294-Rhodomonas_salina.1